MIKNIVVTFLNAKIGSIYQTMMRCMWSSKEVLIALGMVLAPDAIYHQSDASVYKMFFHDNFGVCVQSRSET